MNTINFTKIAETYESNSLVQNSASSLLLSLLEIQQEDNILDVGCGTGNITAHLKELTKGNVVGVDPSAEMIEKAKEKNKALEIIFQIASSEKLNYNNNFNVIFCNSVFQWFKTPEESIQGFYKALAKGGRVGIQAPATKAYCPNFVNTLDSVRQDSRTAEIFANFKNPWFFLETAEEYSDIFNKLGFKVVFSTIDKIVTKYTPEEVFKIFSSGAIAGYLNQDSYSKPIDENYISAFKEIVKDNIDNQKGADGLVDLVFNRIFLVAVKV